MNAQADSNLVRISRSELKRLQQCDHDVGKLRVENLALRAKAAADAALIEKLRTTVTAFAAGFVAMLPVPEKGTAPDDNRR